MPGVVSAVEEAAAVVENDSLNVVAVEDVVPDRVAG